MLRLLLIGCSIASTTALGSIARSSAVVLRGGSTRARTLVASATATENPLLLQEGLPRFASIDAVHVKDAVATTLMQMERQFESLEASLPGGTATPADLYAAVVEAMEKLEAPVDFSWGVVNHLMGVKNSDELRAAHGEMQSEVIKSTTKLSQSVAVFDALVALEKEAAALEPAQRRIVANSLAGMKLSGVGLKGDAKETFNKNRLRLGELSTTFSNNLLDATKAFSLVLRDKEQVKGLPPSALALAASRAAQAGEAGATAEAGPWKLGLDMPSYLPAMKFLEDRSVRESLYRAFVTRAGEANAPLIVEILRLREEQARMLGFRTHAEVSLSRKMALTVEAVDALTEMLRSKAYPAAQKELEQLTAFARSKGFAEPKLALWDVPFWSERLSEHTFGFEEEELKPYFALDNVLDGLFGVCTRLFGVRIERADGEAEVWHPDVGFFKVIDEASGEHLASFFLDPYARPANKRGGAWMGSCVGRSRVLNRKPVAYLTCNGSPPVEGQPSLMTFSEVTTLFHETGHGLQHMLTEVTHAPAAGISGVEWDAVELPSQFMENFCFEEATMYGADGRAGLAKHYQTGQPLPRDLFEKLCKQKTFQAGMGMVRQLNLGALDMALHHRFDPNDASTSPFELQRQIAQTFSVIPPLETDRFLCGFSHIFAGGYSAGYYSYKWAEVLSADAFAAFEEVGLENEEAVRAVGRRFRETVLALGGGTPPAEVFKAFRGREPDPQALLRHSGLL